MDVNRNFIPENQSIGNVFVSLNLKYSMDRSYIQCKSTSTYENEKELLTTLKTRKLEYLG